MCPGFTSTLCTGAYGRSEGYFVRDVAPSIYRWKISGDSPSYRSQAPIQEPIPHHSIAHSNCLGPSGTYTLARKRRQDHCVYCCFTYSLPANADKTTQATVHCMHWGLYSVWPGLFRKLLSRNLYRTTVQPHRPTSAPQHNSAITASGYTIVSACPHKRRLLDRETDASNRMPTGRCARLL